MLTAGHLPQLQISASPSASRTPPSRCWQSQAEPTGRGPTSRPALFETSAAELLRDPELAREIFGPSTLIVRYESRAELIDLANSLEGQLTATLHADGSDIADYADLVAILETKAGRLVVNGYPTGVEVCHAMVHGGPYPATSDSRHTSVGTQAIYRFARPVCYQDFRRLRCRMN